MDEQVLVATRRSLHGVAELLIAGPQFREHGTIKLRSTPGGFGGWVSPTRVAGTELVWSGGTAALAGSAAELAAVSGIVPGAPGNYSDTSGLDPDEALSVDPAAAELLERWYSRGDAALRALAGPDGPEPVLWPEHFDLAISLDEVNYGVSPGDGGHQRPYAYVGPWTFSPPPGPGGFWNASFGALRDFEELPDADAVAAFFAEGRAAAAAMGSAGGGGAG